MGEATRPLAVQSPYDIPEYLTVPAADLGRGTPVKVRVLHDMAAVACDMAQAMLAEILDARAAGRGATLIVPVGPVDQFPLLAERINARQIDCRDVMFINMDEYLTDDDCYVAEDHPLSSAGYMERAFLPPSGRGDCTRRSIACFPTARPAADRPIDRGPRRGRRLLRRHRHQRPHRLQRTAGAGRGDKRGGICRAAYAGLVAVAETRTINSVTVGGEIAVIPRRAVTVGMRECLSRGGCGCTATGRGRAPWCAACCTVPLRRPAPPRSCGCTRMPC